MQTLRFNPDMSIEEVGASILEKTGEGDESYGIYMEGKLGVSCFFVVCLFAFG
jgi:hypothetical protein